MGCVRTGCNSLRPDFSLVMMKVKIKDPKGLMLLGLNLVLMGPAVLFWISVMIVVTLGTDYLFDVVVAQMRQTGIGQLALVMAILVCPSIGLGMNYMTAKKKKRRWQEVAMVLAGGMVVWAILGII